MMTDYSGFRLFQNWLFNKPVPVPLIILIGLILVAATGCVESRARYTPVPSAPAPTPTRTATATPEPTATVIPAPSTATPVPTATPTPPTPTPVPTAVPTVIVTPTIASGTFNLTYDFEGVNDNGIVFSDIVLLRGHTSADAVVSVNGVIVEVQTDGSFELTIVLDLGPNFVDIVASNLDGSNISASLAIISILPDVTP